MSLTKFNEATNNIQGLADKPTLPAEDLKAKFDKVGADLKDYINNTLTPEIDDLTNKTATSYATVYNHYGSIYYNKIGKILSMKLEIDLGNSRTTESGELIANIPYYNTPRNNPFFICPVFKDGFIFTFCIIEIYQNGNIHIYSLDGNSFFAEGALEIQTEILYMLD